MNEPFETSQGEAMHTKGAAALLGVSEHTLRWWRKPQMLNGKLQPIPIPFLKMRGRVRYLVSDLRAYQVKARNV